MWESKYAITAVKITKVYGNGNIGLHETSFNIPKGTITAILGPSGCGKSTLLKSLNGYSPATSGEVFIEKHKLDKRNFDSIKDIIGYVPQDDTIYTNLTVYENLYYAANLRLPNRSKQYKIEKINEVLEELGIVHLKSRKVSELSGGQRKRACISLELLTNPKILFLDEPTSPLDPQTISDFLTRLQGLTKKGTTVLMVTHKPEDLKYMDYTMFLSVGGEVAYFGKTSTYNTFFETDNVLEIYKVLSSDERAKFIRKYKNTPLNIKPPNTPKLDPKNNTDYTIQFIWLVIRGLNLKINDLGNLSLLLLQAPIIALLMILVFDEINTVVLFFIVVSSIWFGANNAVREIVGEINIYTRERMFNLSIFPYLFSKISVLGVLAIIQSFLFSGIMYLAYNDGFVNWMSISKSTLWLFVINLTGAMLGLLISSLVSNSEKAMTIVPIILIPQIILGGVIVKTESMFTELLSYLTISRWGTTGLAKVQKEIAIEHFDVKIVNGKPEVVQSGFKTANSLNALKTNFHSSFESSFSTFDEKISVDLFFILSMMLLFYIATFLSIKDKDKIT
jgi:ABC transport system ATP-binding/permease protein